MNTDKQNEHLDYIIAKLLKWREGGIPPFCLVRLWDSQVMDNGSVMTGATDVSSHMNTYLAIHMIGDWLKDIATDAAGQDSRQHQPLTKPDASRTVA